MLSAREAVADQSSLAANLRQFLDVSLQKNTEDFLMRILDHVRDEEVVFCKNSSYDCCAIKTMVRVDCEDIRRNIAEESNRIRNLPAFRANDKSGAGDSSGTSGDG